MPTLAHIALLVLALGSASATAPEIVLTPPGPVLVGEPVAIATRGLAPSAEVRLTAEWIDRERRVWRSSGEFRVGEDGRIDLGRDAPLRGSWSGIDAMGPFWSMERTADAAPAATGTDATAAGATGTDAAAAERRSDVVIAVRQGERELARATLGRWRALPDVTRLEVEEEGLVASLHLPANARRTPVVILIGGSGGGIRWQEDCAGLLASHGLAALALAYFDMEGLPKTLDRIPLEYFDRAIAWLRTIPDVDATRLALCGVSKGGELALLYASRRPAVKAVAAYVPASHVFQSIGGTWASTSSWTEKGEPVPFVPYARRAPGGPLVELYRASLDSNAERALAAEIPVERIAGPILFVSGRADSIWPSTPMCEAMVKRLESAKHPHAVRHLAYDDADHGVSVTGWTPVPETVSGGTRVGLARARADAWPRVVAFLRESLGVR